MPALPVTGLTVRGATAAAPTKVKQQIYTEFTVQGITLADVFLVIPKLTSPCIIGIGLLTQLQATIDLSQDIITVHKEQDAIPMKLKREHPASEGITTSKLGNEEWDASEKEIIDKIDEIEWPNDDERGTLRRHILEYKDIFSKRPGKLTTYQHRLEVMPHTPYARKPYPIPIAHREKVTEEINKMLELGIIQRSNSPYVNPLVVVHKKDGSLRLCLDARRLNSILIAGSECMQTMEVLFQECTNANVMSTLDLTSSFWQVPLHPDSRKYTAFLHQGRCYEFIVTPFGLKTSTAALVRGLEPVLRNVSAGILNFVDDILCTARTFEQHIEQLRRFLGHVITPKGIHPDPTKLQAIQEAPSPKNVQQLRGFLGLINFYTKFNPTHAKVITPLLQLVKKGQRWKWDEDKQLAFEKAKDSFCKEVTLQFPKKDRPFYLQTDASDYALGAVLYQLNDEGQQEPIHFASRTLKGPELAYFTTEKELLGIVWALKKFRSYLFGSKVIIVTDHQALTFLRSCQLLNARLTRWTLAIQDYDLEIQYCKGSDNVVADYLSRASTKTAAKDGIDLRGPKLNRLAKEPNKELEGLCKNLATKQDEDDEVKALKERVRTTGDTHYRLEGNKLLIQKGGWYKYMVPSLYVDLLINECHEIYGHCGAKKCYLILRETFYFPRCYKRIRKRLSACDSCQRNKIYTVGSFAEMQNIIPRKPRELASVDFYGPLPTGKGGVKYIPAIIDVFSKVTALYALKRATAEATLKCLRDRYIPRFGTPKKLLSDQGTQFTSDKWREGLQQEGIQHILTSIRHPQANPVERTNRELARYFRTFLNNQHSRWADWLDVLEDGINHAYHEATGCIPMQLHDDIRPPRPWERWLESYPRNIAHPERLVFAYKNITREGRRRAQRFNKQHKITEYNVGDLVLVRALNVSKPEKNISAKFLPLYERPYEVARITAEGITMQKHSSPDLLRARAQIEALEPLELIRHPDLAGLNASGKMPDLRDRYWRYKLRARYAQPGVLWNPAEDERRGSGPVTSITAWQKKSAGEGEQFGVRDLQKRLKAEAIKRTQAPNETIATYLLKLRLLYSHPDPPMSEEEQLDWTYENLHSSYRERISRRTVHTFRDLKELGQEVEMDRLHRQTYAPPPSAARSAVRAAVYADGDMDARQAVQAVEA
ncbi:uncharacterized protein LOC111674083 [Orussus abietinus]|uniref:uncharacterized protein LOC111674083 n=1 Tax=Orussus abietinus TaxID=222816 RepID=UPI000C71628E|nr:uncharacterized protein LOC111674083 [Orussus abietinus]